ncbi:MAG: NAD(+)/NADH kinase [Bacteroidales bacterium]|nr:NAD(+)/NADH kinase [Bacteroidales bacterium]
MKIALYVRHLEPSLRQQLLTLIDRLHASGIETDEVSETLPVGIHYDFLLSIGGDGTLLSSVHLIGSRDIPVLGINFGHLGFLTTAGHDDIDTLVSDIMGGRYTLEPRTLLQIITNPAEDPLIALNEVCLHRLDDAPLLRTDLFVDNDFVATYGGDGLIVATPTGSTAYSLSCGGPILTPNSGCFVITPIGVHNLTLRPIIVPDGAYLRLVTHPHPQPFNLSADSRRLHLACGTEVHIARAPFTVRLVRLHRQTFFTAIHQKLGWNF